VVTKKLNTWKFLTIAALAAYGAAYVSRLSDAHIVDELDFILYRCGHLLFSPLGELQQHLGGSVAQCLIPALVIGFFCWKRQFHVAAGFGFWLGINFLSVSMLVAGAGSAPPAGSTGGDAIADWHWVLNHFNALNNAATLATVFRIAGYATFALSTISGVVFSREPVAEPAPSSATHHALSGVDQGSDKLAQWENTVKYSPGFAPSTKSIIVIVCVIGGAVALWNHGWEWGAPKPAWPNNYVQGATQAKAEQKPLVLSFTGSDWCPACQELDKYVLDTATFRDYAAKNLVFIEVDMPQHKSQPAALQQQNLQLVMKYDVHGFPTLVILSSKGIFLDQIVGYADLGPKGYIAEIEKIAGIGGNK